MQIARRLGSRNLGETPAPSLNALRGYMIVFVILFLIVVAVYALVFLFTSAINEEWSWVPAVKISGIVYAAIAVLFSGCMGTCAVTDACDTGTVVQTGIITTLGKSGLLWKTYEGRMTVGVLNDGSGSSSRSETHFCVDDPSLLDQVDKARRSNKPVMLTFEGRAATAPWHCSSDIIVKKVEYLQ